MALDAGAFVVLRYLSVELYLANFISINMGITLSFFLNTYFNFRKTDMIIKRAISFYSVGYLGLLISSGIILVGTNFLHIPDSPVKMYSIIIIAMFQFALNKFVTFGRRTSFLGKAGKTI
ncbi:GtrA-like protein [Peptococcaceae bacterium CEB3]|nr:GtrA-like protein [Peptococcaceae bacterium CEB3]